MLPYALKVYTCDGVIGTLINLFNAYTKACIYTNWSIVYGVLTLLLKIQFPMLHHEIYLQKCFELRYSAPEYPTVVQSLERSEHQNVLHFSITNKSQFYHVCELRSCFFYLKSLK